MEQIFPENWAFMHFGLIFSITCAQMLIVYVLSDSSNPPAGLGLFTVYFMAAMLGWIAVTLRFGEDTPMTVDVPAAANIINSYILFLAAGNRAGLVGGRIILGLLCLASFLAIFFLPPTHIFTVQSAAATLFHGGVSILCARRAWKQKNVGDAIIAYAALMTAVGLPAALFEFHAIRDPGTAQAIAFGLQSATYALIAIGFLASVLIEYQQHLSRQATEDPLTGLLNRRGLRQALQISLAQAARHGSPTSAIMIDVDLFKQINDSFGHETGDRVIQQISRLLERISRATDVVARSGGDEFLLVLPDTDMDAARLLAERIRSAVGARPMLVDNQRIHVTLSLGIATSTGDVDLDKLSQDADRALYLAKSSGRDRVNSVDRRPVRLSSPEPEQA